MSDDTDMGPLVNEEGLNNIDSIVKDSVKEGAELLTGGERIKKVRVISTSQLFSKMFLQKCV